MTIRTAAPSRRTLLQAATTRLSAATTRLSAATTLLLAATIFALFVAGLAVGSSATAKAADASAAANTCPLGFVLSADGSVCHEASKTKTVDGPRTCALPASLTPEGTHCWVPPLVKSEPFVETAPPIRESSLACPDGSFQRPLDGANPPFRCERTIGDTTYVSPITVNIYSCPPGAIEAGSGSGLTCGLPTPGAPPFPAASVTTWSCPEGSTETGGSDATLTCTDGTDSIDPETTTIWVCPSGTTAEGAGSETMCAYPMTLGPVDPIVTETLACPEGSDQQGAGETITCSNSISAVIEVDPVTIDLWRCPDGYEADGTGAEMTCSRTTAGALISYCENGADVTPMAINGQAWDGCIVGSSTVTSKVVRHCPRGVLSADETLCIVNATPKVILPGIKVVFAG